MRSVRAAKPGADRGATGTATVVQGGGFELALVNVDGTLFAVHMGGFLGEGQINDDWSEWAIECPMHGSVSTSELVRCSIHPRRRCERIW
jgi:nitrite reductase/ring-hydroxylating ferredoxin subunit